jgi:hypothetical protein
MSLKIRVVRLHNSSGLPWGRAGTQCQDPGIEWKAPGPGLVIWLQVGHPYRQHVTKAATRDENMLTIMHLRNTKGVMPR